VVKLAFWAMASDATDVSSILVEGIAAAPPDFVEGALDRMESMRSGLFWEVNERVIAFDWVEEPLRAQIPRLRAALRRAKGGPAQEPAAPASDNLVAPAAASPEVADSTLEPAHEPATNGTSGQPAVRPEQGVAAPTP